MIIQVRPYKLKHIKTIFSKINKIAAIGQKYDVFMYIPYPPVIPIRCVMSKQVHKVMPIL